MAIHMEAQPFAASQTFKLGDLRKEVPSAEAPVKAAPKADSPFVVSVRLQPSNQVYRVSAAQQAPVAPVETAVSKSLRQLDSSYNTLRESVDLKKFDPAKIDDYLRAAERETGVLMRDEEKAQLRQLAQSQDPNVRKLVALELRVGISEKAEAAALAAMGRLMLHRNQTQALQAYLQDDTKDPNLKAHVKTLLMMNRVEGVLHTYESTKRKVQSLVPPWLFPPVASNN